MDNANTAVETKPVKLKKESNFVAVIKRMAKNRVAVVSAIVFLLLVLAAIFAPLIAPYSYTEMDLAAKNQGPSLAHLFGTDEMGRDILSRILYGGRYSISAGILAVCVQMIFGVICGSIAGFFGGRVDNIIMRVLDVIQSIPNTILMIAIAAALGNGYINTVLALGISNFPQCSRLLRSQMLSTREQEYVSAAELIGCSKVRQIMSHVLPNSWQPLIVSATMGVANNILQLASLSFLGLGIQPPTPEWGAILSSARKYITMYPYQLVFPGIAIAITVLVLNLMGDGLRDALDPKLKD